MRQGANKVKIAINQNEKIFKHSSQWTYAWIDYCKRNQVQYDILDCYKYDIIKRLPQYKALFWHVEGYSPTDMLVARSILHVASNMGISTFPNDDSVWHFDDKVAEMYLLDSVSAPIPKSWVFYSKDECIDWIIKEANYPIVAKLRSGSGSSNVKLLSTKTQALLYAKRMFGAGFSPTPNIAFKIKSQLLSAKNSGMIMSRIKRVPDFIETLKSSKWLPNERGYVYFQEFVPNDGFDLKIAVVGHKLSYIVRRNRRNDFRASGGGDLSYIRDLVPPQIISQSFEISEKLGFQSMGYDWVIDVRDRSAKILEMSYAFSYKALLDAGGFWDKSHIWHNEALNAPNEIIGNMLSGRQDS